MEETNTQATQEAVEYHLINSVDNYELRLYADNLDNIHYKIIDTANDPPNRDLVYKFQGDAFSEWKTIKKTIASNEINEELKELRKSCDKIASKAKNIQGSLFNPDDEEGAGEADNDEE